MKTLASIVLGIVAIGALAVPAAAQSAPAATQAPPIAVDRWGRELRHGLTFGVGAGVGSLVADCDECRDTFEAGGLSGHIGWMITPRLWVGLDVWGMAHHESFLTVFQNINTLAARLWLAPSLWVQGGIGNANAGYRWDGVFFEREDKTETTAGMMLGAGYEIPLRPHLVLDLELRYGTGFYDEEIAGEYVVEGHSASLGVGLSWY